MSNNYLPKIRLLVALNSMNIGGIQKLVADQLSYLNRDIFDIFLVVMMQYPDLKDFYGYLPKDITVYKLNFKNFLDFKEWFKLIKLLFKTKPQVVKTAMFFTNIIFRVLKPWFNYFLFTEEHNVYLSRNFFERFFNRITSSLVTKILAVSNSVKDYLVKIEKIKADKVEVIYNGVDLEKYVFLNERRLVERKFYRLDKQFVILSIGRVSIQKNYQLLLEVAYEVNILRKEEIYFFVAGDNTNHLGEELKKQLEVLGLAKFVYFLGVQKNIPDLLNLADAFLMTSLWEGFGLALIEAMANGKPVVVNNIHTLKELLGENNEFGLVGKNKEEIVDFLIKLKNDKDFYKKYQKQSLARAQDFSLKKHLEKITGLLSSAVKN